MRNSARVVLGIAVVLILRGSPASAARYHYTGRVGAAMPIQMELSISGSSISGYYYYNRTGVPIPLKGSSSRQVFEYANGRQPSATFSGNLRSSAQSWSGTWTSADGKRKYPFSVRAVARYTASKQKVNGVEEEIVYPLFLGTAPAIASLNRSQRQHLDRLRDDIQKEAKAASGPAAPNGRPWSFVYSRDVEYYSPDLVSLSGSLYEFTGGAHGMAYAIPANYRLVGGRAQVATLGSLFRPGYLPALSRLILTQLRRKRAEWVLNGQVRTLKENDLKAYTITPRGLTFYFDPYAMGPYAQGPFIVTLPYSAIRRHIRPGGPLARFI